VPLSLTLDYARSALRQREVKRRRRRRWKRWRDTLFKCQQAKEEWDALECHTASSSQ
jgi:hypothetical protein